MTKTRYDQSSEDLKCRNLDKANPWRDIPSMTSYSDSLIELIEAAQAVIDRWDSPKWKDMPATASYVNNLRNAISAMNMGDASTRKDEEAGLKSDALETSPAKCEECGSYPHHPSHKLLGCDTASEIRVFSESERYGYWRDLIDQLPDFRDPEKPWVWSDEEIKMLRAACARRFGESLRTESLFCIAATGIRIYLSRKPKPVSVEDCAKALFDHEQGGLFPPKLSNMALYGREVVTWEFINDDRFVSACSDNYRKQAKTVLDAAGVKYV